MLTQVENAVETLYEVKYTYGNGLISIILHVYHCTTYTYQNTPNFCIYQTTRDAIIQGL